MGNVPVAAALNPPFASVRNPQVSQAGIRHVATKVFQHMHDLDLRFHLDRQTGAVTRIIDRGTRGINFILSSMLFNVFPTAIEFVLVSGILYVKCGPAFAALTAATVAAYSFYTVSVTSWRTQFRRVMNKMDSQVHSPPPPLIFSLLPLSLLSPSPPLPALSTFRTPFLTLVLSFEFAPPPVPSDAPLTRAPGPPPSTSHCWAFHP